MAELKVSNSYVGNNPDYAVKVTTPDAVVLPGNVQHVIVDSGGTGGGGGPIEDGVSTTIKATVLDYANSNPLAVRLTDTNGDYIAGGGGGDATAANQVTGNASLASIDGKITAVNTGAVVVSSSALPTGASTEATLSTLNGKVTACNTGAVTISAALPAGTNNIGDVDVLSSALPTGASTSANQTTIIGHLDGVEALLTTIDADTSTLAGAVSGTEMQVDVLTMPTTTVQATNLDIRDLTSVSDSVAAAQSGTWNITNVSGTISLPTGAATAAKQDDIITAIGAIPGGGVQYTTGDVDTTVTGNALIWFDATDTALHVTETSGLPTFDSNVENAVNQTTNTLNAAYGSDTANLSNVAASATSVSILAANPNRTGLILCNDSSSAMYLKYGTTASTSSFTYKIPANSNFEMAFPIFRGAIDAIWDSATGNARVTEQEL